MKKFLLIPLFCLVYSTSFSQEWIGPYLIGSAIGSMVAKPSNSNTTVVIQQPNVGATTTWGGQIGPQNGQRNTVSALPPIPMRIYDRIPTKIYSNDRTTVYSTQKYKPYIPGENQIEGQPAQKFVSPNE